MRDLENKALCKDIDAFATCVYAASKRIASILGNMERDEIHYCNYLEKGRLHSLLARYCAGVNALTAALQKHALKSEGLLDFAAYLYGYAQSQGFKAWFRETLVVKAELSTMKYCLLIKNGTVKVRKYEGEPDHNPDIARLFEKFRQDSVKWTDCRLTRNSFADHVEANILSLVAKWYPSVFERLDKYCETYREGIDKTLLSFSKDIQFYLAYLGYMERFKAYGLRFCYPKLSTTNKLIRSKESFDLALAGKLMMQNKKVVCNDFSLAGKERIIVVTGPNQGGKTTFARTFGQLHHLASLGCLVAGSEADLFLFDRIFTHFEREENIETLNGKLQDDLVRMHEILKETTERIIIIVNEILSSTSLVDSIEIGKRLMDRIIAMDAICLYVTFLDELSAYGEKNVSMVATVVPENPVQRTYKIVRKKADGLAFAIHIANK